MTFGGISKTLGLISTTSTSPVTLKISDAFTSGYTAGT
jgi:hypothetical protein